MFGGRCNLSKTLEFNTQLFETSIFVGQLEPLERWRNQLKAFFRTKPGDGNEGVPQRLLLLAEQDGGLVKGLPL